MEAKPPWSAGTTPCGGASLTTANASFVINPCFTLRRTWFLFHLTVHNVPGGVQSSTAPSYETPRQPNKDQAMSQVKQEPATATATATTRTSRNICDGCAFRRVKCDGLDPCAECESRSVRCSHLRVRRKRGPKGPRASTAQKIQAVQGRLLQANGVATMRDGSSVAHPYEHDSIIETVKPHTPSGGVARYGDYIRIFKARLYLTWPVVDPDALLARLEKGDEHDWGSYALAASLSAAVIAQLRLSDIADRRPDRHALTFAQQARRLQSELDFQDRCELDSLLVSFFLHMYFANVQKEATATLMLRDAISRAHVLGLHRPRSWQKDLFADESQRLLLIYWILFVTERFESPEQE